MEDDQKDLEKIVLTRLLRLNATVQGCVTGTVAGLAIFVATNWLVLKGGDVVGPRLQLLENYFPAYTVTLSGSLLGLAYGFLTGFIGGWGFAFLRNITVFLYMALIRRHTERQLLKQLLEYV